MIKSYSNVGYEGCIVDVEVDIRDEMKVIDLAGIPDSSVQLTKEVARAAAEASGFPFPDKRILVSLSPCEIRKPDNYEFAVALAVIAKIQNLKDTDIFCMGIMNIRGELTTTFRGVQAGLMSAAGAGIKYAVLPFETKENLVEIPDGIKVAFCGTLKDAVIAISAIGTSQEDMFFDEKSEYIEKEGFFPDDTPDDTPFLPEFSEDTVFAIIAAAAGKHNILLWGNDIDQCDNALLGMEHITPYLTEPERRTANRIHSIAGDFTNDSTKYLAPFRLPYKNATIERVCGGGANALPGEISLAHNGTLLLLDAAEFRSFVLQMLRVPLGNHSIIISRAGHSTTYPADFQLGITMKACPCGFRGSKNGRCLCSHSVIEMYVGKVAKPLLDNIEIVVKAEPYKDGDKIYTYGEAKEMVRTAIETQRKRGFYNRNASPEFIRQTEEEMGIDENDLPPANRAALENRIKLARTLADIKGTVSVSCGDYISAESLRNTEPLCGLGEK